MGESRRSGRLRAVLLEAASDKFRSARENDIDHAGGRPVHGRPLLYGNHQGVAST